MTASPTQIPAYTDCDLPFSNVAYRGGLILANAWTVFVTLYQTGAAGLVMPQTVVWGPVVATITSGGAGTPTIPAQYLTPQSTFLARTQAFPQANLLSPPNDGSFKWTNDLNLQTGS